MKKNLNLIKVGGALLENDQARQEFLKRFAQLPEPKVLVHGGGREASRLAEQLGQPSQLVDGRRITDAFQLKIAVMVYAGGVNKQVVAELQSEGCNALGLSGADGNLIRAHKRPVKAIDYGWVGDIEEVNASFLTALLESNISPVICALTHDGQGQLLNTNADTIASHLAIALAQHYKLRLIYCFEHPGVLANLRDPSSLYPEIWEHQLPDLVEKKIVAEGMRPKLHNGFDACRGGVQEVWIGNTEILSSPAPKGTRLQVRQSKQPQP